MICPRDHGSSTRASPRCSIIRALPLKLREPPKKNLMRQLCHRARASPILKHEEVFSCIMHAVHLKLHLATSLVCARFPSGSVLFCSNDNFLCCPMRASRKGYHCL